MKQTSSWMKGWSRGGRLLGAALIGASVLYASIGQAAAPAMLATKHNLGTGNTLPGAIKQSGASATDQVCVFCHTPHGSNSNSTVNRPLWNRAYIPDTSIGFNAYTGTGLESEILAIGSVSVACLSCHDGTQAVDAMINTAGSGSTGSQTTPSATLISAIAGRVTVAGVLDSANMATIGKDLRNDHPIGVRYCGATGTSDTCGDTTNWVAVSKETGSNLWWVETGGNTTRNKNDMILYARTFVDGGTRPSVECATCHDPHSTNGLFLRVENTASAVCVACHVK